MAKYLDSNGLSTLWSKVKKHVSDNYVPKTGGVITGALNVEGTDSDGAGLHVRGNIVTMGDVFVDGNVEADTIKVRGGSGDGILLDNGDITSLQNIKDAISAIPKFAIKVVDNLPTENIETATVYLVKHALETDKNLYTEYIYVQTIEGGKWEKLGQQNVDLSNYITRDSLVFEWAETSGVIMLYLKSKYDGVTLASQVLPYASATLNGETLVSGLMSGNDKFKLNGIASGATADSALTTTEVAAICV